MKNLLTARILKSHLIITFGLLLTALGWTAFLIPAEITGGGITGVSTLIFYGSGFPYRNKLFNYKCCTYNICYKNTWQEFWCENHLQCYSDVAFIFIFTTNHYKTNY